jgi:hypothetical protein
MAAIIAAGSAAELTGAPRADLAYLVHAAGQVLDGARLYVDIVEINPPLIVALNLPAALAARAVGVADILAYRVTVVSALLGALAFCGWCLGRLPGCDAAAPRHRLLLVLAAVLFLAAGEDFGQREHLLAALALPYLLLAAGRVQGRPAPGGPAVAAGMLAGLGIALKPHFLLLWAGVEGYAMWRLRTRRPSPETLGLAGFLGAYLAGVVILTPDYFRLVGLLGPAYGGFGHAPLAQVLVTAPGTALCALAVLAWAALRSSARCPELWTVLLLATIASFLAGAAQQKGWGYHFYPSRVLALVLLAIVALDARRPLLRPVSRLYAAVAAAAFGASIALALAAALGRVLDLDPGRRLERARLETLVAAVRRHAPPGGSLYALSFTNESGFPLVNNSGVRWASRFPHLWILEASYRKELRAAPPLRFHAPERMAPAERYLNEAVYEDLSSHRPDLLLVLRHARDIPRNAHRRLDYLAYFSRDPRIAAELGRYRLVEEVDEYRLYARGGPGVGPGTAPAPERGRYDLPEPGSDGPGTLLANRGFLLGAGLFLILAAVAYAAESRGVSARQE